MHPTSAERIQTQLIAEYQSGQQPTPKTINFNINRYSVPLTPQTPVKQRDHSRDFFYNVSRNLQLDDQYLASEDHMYRRSRDVQKTDISNLTEQAQRNSASRKLETPIKFSPPPNEITKYRRNISSMDAQIPKTDLRIQTDNLNILSQVLNVNENQTTSKQRNKQMQSKESIGAISNKLYNSTIRQYPDQGNEIMVTLNLAGNGQLDESKLKRELAQDGISRKHYFTKEYKLYQSISVVVRLRTPLVNPDRELSKVVKHLESQGIQSSIPVVSHHVLKFQTFIKIKQNKGEKTWMRQKVAYKSMGFFANRDNDRLKTERTSQRAVPNQPQSCKQEHKPQSASITHGLHNILKKGNYK